MKSKGLFVISKKEFHDHMMSKKFLIIFTIILITTIIGMSGGAIDYNEQIKNYADNQVIAEEKISMSSYFLQKPSVMIIFSNVAMVITSLGAILGIAMGFDLITREKESKSLKILLSHPIFRDEVINGKAIGGTLALIIALLITFVISMALLMIFSIIPGPDEISYILIFGISALLMVFSYFAISLFMSTVADTSGNSLIYTLIVFIVLTGLFPMLISGPVMDVFAGDAPEPPTDLHIQRMTSSYTSSQVVTISSESGDKTVEESYNPYDTEEWRNYQQESQNYWQKRQTISDFFNLLSPTNNFQHIATYLAYPQIYKNMYGYNSFSVEDGAAEPEKTSIFDVFGELLKNFVALLAFPAVFFGLAYVYFMRMDIR